MEILANDRQLRSLANIYTYFYPGSGRSIVIATTNPLKNAYLFADFEQKNHCIEMCNSNASILRAVQKHVVDALIIDHDYNSMEGIKLLELIRKIDQQLPVIFIGKNDTDPDSELLSIHIWDLETNDYRTELIEPADLVRTVERTISDKKHAGKMEKILQQIYTIRTFTVYDIYVIGSDGRLLYHHSNNLLTQVDEDIFSGMFTVLQFFLDDLFRKWPGEVKAIDYHSIKILVEHAPDFHLVVIGAGDVLDPVREQMAKVARHISKHYGLLIANWTGNVKSVAGLKEEVKGIIKVQ